jgi:hypothetical protein
LNKVKRQKKAEVVSVNGNDLSRISIDGDFLRVFENVTFPAGFVTFNMIVCRLRTFTGSVNSKGEMLLRWLHDVVILSKPHSEKI